MKFHRIQNPTVLNATQISTLLQNGAETVVIQFSESSTYGGELLQELDRMCERFGSRLNVRFYGHYGSEFDCRNLLHLPSVRSLNLDCLMKVANLQFLYELELLEEFAFDVFEANVPYLLENKALTKVRKIVLSGTRKNNIDLEPLGAYSQLETLFLNGHTRNIQSIKTLPRLQKLSLGGIGKRVPLGFVGSIRPLKSLTYILGGRESVNDLAHTGLHELEILRVLGLSEIDLKLFPNLERLRVEDQLRLRDLDIRPLRALRRLSIFNCKNLGSLLGIDAAHSLESLRVGLTSVDLDAVLDNIPPGVKGLTLQSPRKSINDRLQTRVGSRGLPSALYIGAP